MTHENLRRALSLIVLLGPFALMACGDYSAEPEPGGGSNAGATSNATGGGAGSATTGGSSAPGGSSGASGAAGIGGRETAPPPSCENVIACGGDPVAVWFATASCLPVSGIADLAGLGIGCTSAPVSGKLEVTGNWTVSADGKLSDNTSTTGKVVLELAPPCLDVSGTVTMCAKIGSPLASAGFVDATCVDSTNTLGGCTCTGTVQQSGGMGYVSFDASKNGTYTTSGSTLTVSSVKDVDYAYCVAGNFMLVTPTTPNIIGTTAGTVVFQRQP
jgi:hypothetical protein